MPEHLDRIQVATSTTGVITITWEGRQELLERARELTEGDELRRRFELVGGKRPVELHGEEREAVLRVVERWVSEVGARNVPTGIVRLRDALLEDEIQGTSA